eukprot:Awhi_evm1s12296
MLTKKDTRNVFDQVVEDFDLKKVLDRAVQALSGGELQRFACAFVCCQKSD